MKKTHKAVLKYIKINKKAGFGELRGYLIKLFPDMKIGLNVYNMGRLMSNLVKRGYVVLKSDARYNMYFLTERGKTIILKAVIEDE